MAKAKKKKAAIPAVIAKPPSTVSAPAPVERALQNLSPVPAPMFSAGSVAIQSTGNDFVFLFQRAMPVQNATGQHDRNIAINQIVAMVSMSPQTAKDLSLILGPLIANHEKSFGKMSTPFTKRRATNGGRKKAR